MKIVKWAAVLVTALMALMNLGVLLVAQSTDTGTAAIIFGVVLGVAGIAAVIGLTVNTSWGRMAVVGVGAVNAAAAIIFLTQNVEGASIGLAIAALGTVLGWFSPRASAPVVTA